MPDFTYLVTDIEGSTRLWELQPRLMQECLARHDSIIRQATADRQGQILKTIGDAFWISFENEQSALDTAFAIQSRLQTEQWPAAIGQIKVRMLLQTAGQEHGPSETILLKLARVLAAGHGGQVLYLAGDRLPAGAEIKDLGLCRVNGFSETVHLLQLNSPGLPDKFPPLRTEYHHLNHLVENLPQFTGRPKELAELTKLLLHPPTRLLNLTGAPGCGKTRLALEVACQTGADFPDRVHFIRLESVEDEAALILTLAENLGIRANPGQPLKIALKESLRGKRLLLVLDGFEHLTGCNSLIEELLQASPGLKIMLTSRSLAHVRGEQIFRLKPLPLPPTGKTIPLKRLAENEAVALLVNLRRQRDPGFNLHKNNCEAILSIIQKTDGIPLEIELAAVRLDQTRPENLAAELSRPLKALAAKDSLPGLSRYRSLRETYQHSYELLEPDEQLLLARLSVLGNSFSLEQVEAICHTDPVEGITRLLDQSLLEQRAGNPKAMSYYMLGTLREFAAEKLAENGETEKYRRLALKNRYPRQL